MSSDKIKILIVDDDPKIVASLRRGLVYDGYDVVTASNGMTAVDAVASEKPDVIILDVLMPGMNGFETCPYIREISEAPILMLTAKDEVSDKVKGLGCGADDYMVKPYAYDELHARIRALVRRTDKARNAGKILEFEDLALDTVRRSASRNGRTFELSTKEYELLYLFMSHPGEVLLRDFLMDRVWGWDYQGESNVLEVYIRYLRSKIESGGEKRLLHTVRGTGYTLRSINREGQ